jgi:hypothetical protein
MGDYIFLKCHSHLGGCISLFTLQLQICTKCNSLTPNVGGSLLRCLSGIMRLIVPSSIRSSASRMGDYLLWSVFYYRSKPDFVILFYLSGEYVLILTKTDLATFWAIFYKRIWSPWFLAIATAAAYRS